MRHKANDSEKVRLTSFQRCNSTYLIKIAHISQIAHSGGPTVDMGGKVAVGCVGGPLVAHQWQG